MKYVKTALWTVVGLVCLQLITYFTLANRSLIRVAMRCRPEYTHFDNADFKWVCLNCVNTEDVDPDLAQDIENEFEAIYENVYYSDRDIPEDYIFYHDVDGNERLAGYREGYVYSIAFKNPGFMNIVVFHHDYEGNMAAFSRQGWYFWVFFGWVRVHTCYATIS